MQPGVIIRPMRDVDLDDADRIFRLAFGTFLGLPNPLAFAGDTDYVRTRHRAEPDAAFVAEQGGEVVGSNLAVRRGSVAFFGPLSVRPDLWEGGIAKQLVAATVDVFTRWDVRHAGLFTFAQSAKHVALYQKFGFWPGSLMAVMTRPAEPGGDAERSAESHLSTYPETLRALPDAERASAIASCREITEGYFPGLDATAEIGAAIGFGLGDVVLVRDGREIAGFAVCHCGPRTEAGSGVCFAKLAVVRPGTRAESALDRLLDGCASLARERGLGRVTAGVSLACRAAYRRLLERGFRTEIQGVAMHRPDDPGYHRPEALLLDDWR